MGVERDYEMACSPVLSCEQGERLPVLSFFCVFSSRRYYFLGISLSTFPFFFDSDDFSQARAELRDMSCQSLPEEGIRSSCFHSLPAPRPFPKFNRTTFVEPLPSPLVKQGLVLKFHFLTLTRARANFIF